jgi:uncharacterized delta-60 repeat protein
MSTPKQRKPTPVDRSSGFSGSGFVFTGFSGAASARAVCVDEDGRVVAAGEYCPQGSATLLGIALARYRPDGTLDETFGVGGRAVVDIAGANSCAYAVGAQSGGRIVVAGGLLDTKTDSSDFALIRLQSNGKVDASFGAGGLVRTSFLGGSNVARALAIDTKDRILAAGSARSARAQDGATCENEYFAVARYQPGGGLDTSFGESGVVITAFSGAASARAVFVDEDGRVVAAGRYCPQGSATLFGIALARYRPDGTLDETFGVGGRAVVDIAGANSCANAVGAQSGGRIVVAGGLLDTKTSSADFALIRLQSNGKADASFGAGGLVRTDFLGGSDETVTALVVQADNRLVAAGPLSRPQLSQDSLAVSRYLADGAPDLTFGSLGSILTEDAGDGAVALALTKTGNLVAAGSTIVDGISRFTLVDMTSPDALYAGVLSAIEVVAGPLGERRESMAQLVADGATAHPARFWRQWDSALTALDRARTADDTSRASILEELKLKLLPSLRRSRNVLAQEVIALHVEREKQAEIAPHVEQEEMVTTADQETYNNLLQKRHGELWKIIRNELRAMQAAHAAADVLRQADDQRRAVQAAQAADDERRAEPTGTYAAPPTPAEPEAVQAAVQPVAVTATHQPVTLSEIYAEEDREVEEVAKTDPVRAAQMKEMNYQKRLAHAQMMAGLNNQRWNGLAQWRW